MEVPEGVRRQSFADAVREGLGMRQKALPARFFYDQRGSELFERITELPEYYLTRCEQSILDRSGNSILSELGPELAIVEFGSGSSKKTRTLIEATLSRQSSLDYYPIDISGDFLRQTAANLQERYEGLTVKAIQAEYFDAISNLPAHDGPRLVLFLGSNIGNFTRAEALQFLSEVSRRLKREDRLLVGTDLQKPPAIIQAAYNDSLGVTAAFNKNVLTRINRELGGEFSMFSFEHEAPYLAGEGKVEMRLVSLLDQEVGIASLGRSYRFREGEWIHTEDSHKFTLQGFEALCSEAGLCLQESYLDDRGWFALNLLQPSD